MSETPGRLLHGVGIVDVLDVLDVLAMLDAVHTVNI